MKNVIMLSFMLLINVLLAQNIKVDIDTDIFNRPEWKTGGDDNWTVLKTRVRGSIYSGNIVDKGETWVTFIQNVGDGMFSFECITDTEENCDKLRFFIDGNLRESLSGEMTKSITINTPVKKGRHIFKWSYSKDSSRRIGKDNVGIWNISYPKYQEEPKLEYQTKVNIVYSDITFHDDISEKSFGNDDGIIQNLETIRVTGILKNQGKEDVNYCLLDIQTPEHVVLLYKTKIPSAIKSQESIPFEFSFVANSLFTQDNIEIIIEAKIDNTIVSSHTFKQPCQRMDLSKQFLEQEKVIQSKKFDYNSKNEIDAFLQKFPESTFAPALFRLRIECCRRFRSNVEERIKNTNTKEDADNLLLKAINEYHEFIEKYPGKMLTAIAIQECFELHTQINRISLYNNFITRYPKSEQSWVASECIKALLFRLVCQQNTIEAYEKFIEMYPSDKFYRDLCLDLAKAKAISTEKDILDKAVQPLTNSSEAQNEKNRRANLIISQILKLRQEYKNLPLSERIQKVLTDTSIERAKAVILALYSDTNAINTVLLLEDVKDIIELNKELNTLLTKYHQETMTSLDTYFSNLEENLNKNFSSLHQDISTLQKSIQNLHQDLKSIGQHIDKRLDKIDEKLIQVDLHIQEGFSNVNQKLDGIDKKLTEGFQQINNHLSSLNQDLNHIKTSLTKIDNGLETLSAQNKSFLLTQSQTLAQLEKMGGAYTGYQNYNPSFAEVKIGEVVGDLIISGATMVFPPAGPILEFGRPVVQWLGTEITGGVMELAGMIF